MNKSDDLTLKDCVREFNDADGRTWRPAATAPWKTVMWVRNPAMKRPVKAVRGYAPDGIVNPDTSLFTTTFTNERYFPTPAGRLACPTEWTECLDDELRAECRADLVWEKEEE